MEVKYFVPAVDLGRVRADDVLAVASDGHQALDISDLILSRQGMAAREDAARHVLTMLRNRLLAAGRS